MAPFYQHKYFFATTVALIVEIDVKQQYNEVLTDYVADVREEANVFWSCNLNRNLMTMLDEFNSIAGTSTSTEIFMQNLRVLAQALKDKFDATIVLEYINDSLKKLMNQAIEEMTVNATERLNVQKIMYKAILKAYRNSNESAITLLLDLGKRITNRASVSAEEMNALKRTVTGEEK
jgi:hypothetical protein